MPDFPPPSLSSSPQHNGPLRVLLADDNRLMLEGLSNLLESSGVQVAGTAMNGLEAAELARTHKPDLILMDIRMPRCDGLTATRLIKAEMPEIKIIILTTSAEDDDLFEAVKSGATGYLLKSLDTAELVECLEQAQQGIPPFSPGLAARLLGEFARISSVEGETQEQTGSTAPKKEEAQTGARLTERQSQVLSLVAQGFSYKEIGARLALSPRTIKYHMAEIMEALHLDNRAQVLAYAGKMGMMRRRGDEETQRRPLS